MLCCVSLQLSRKDFNDIFYHYDPVGKTQKVLLGCVALEVLTIKVAILMSHLKLLRCW